MHKYEENVLLIDDDEDDCFFLKEAMAHVSNEVVLSCIQQTDDLFEVLERIKPSLVLIDFQMPKKNGLDCLREIKGHPDFKNIPVIMLSTASTVSNVIDAYREGAQNYFEKPHCFLKLIEVLKKILEETGIRLEPLVREDKSVKYKRMMCKALHSELPILK